MSRSAFNVGNLGISSALQLTLWPSRPELRELTAEATTALGAEEQAIRLRALGHDFVRYLQFESAELESTHYPGLSGFQITHSVLSKCTDRGRKIEKRSVRILTDKRNGPILRGFGESDDRQEITAVFSHLSAEGWERLVVKLGWNPNDLSQANAPGIVFYPSADPDMTLLGPPYWA
jgi:type II secretory pathway pseudopilin PulG